MNISRFLLVSVFLSAILASTSVTFAAARRGVLVIGDSHSCEAQYRGNVGFGATLARNLASGGVPVSLYCMNSSRPDHWINGQSTGASCFKMSSPNYRMSPCGGVPTFSSLLNNFTGSRVVVALGTNSLQTGVLDNNYKKMAQMIRAKNLECEWVGPPHMDPRKGAKPRGMESHLNSVYSALVTSVSNECSVIDSRNATRSGSNAFETQGDDPPGVHRTAKAAANWANALYPPVSVRTKRPTGSSSGVR